MSWKEYLQETTKKIDIIDLHTFNLSKLYSDFNRKYFENKLPTVPVIIKKLKRAGGVTQVTSKRIGGVTVLSTMKINYVAISSFLETTKERLYGIMAHEMCHVWVHMVDNVFNDVGGQHGYHFKKILNTIQKRTKFNVPMTDDTKGLEISGNVKEKQLYTVLRTHIKTNKYSVVLFNKALTVGDLDRLKENYVWPTSEKLEYYISKERQLLKFPIKRKLTRSISFQFIDKDLAEMIKKNGKYLDTIHPNEDVQKKKAEKEAVFTDFLKKHGNSPLLKIDKI